jgi:hypothetical protein
MAHFGLYWSRVPSKHPDQEIKPPLVLVLDLGGRAAARRRPGAGSSARVRARGATLADRRFGDPVGADSTGSFHP